MATGYRPCRLCLQTFVEGADERLLFTYQPFILRNAEAGCFIARIDRGTPSDEPR